MTRGPLVWVVEFFEGGGNHFRTENIGGLKFNTIDLGGTGGRGQNFSTKNLRGGKF